MNTVRTNKGPISHNKFNAVCQVVYPKEIGNARMVQRTEAAWAEPGSLSGQQVILAETPEEMTSTHPFSQPIR